jgi:hypothetical protein
MPNSVSAKRRQNLRTLVRQFGTLHQELKGTEHVAISDDQKMLAIIERPVRKLFQDAGLDISNMNDWRLIVYVLANGMYSPKGAGRSRRWSKKQIIQLRSDIDNIRKGNSELTDLACCKELVKRNAGNPSYRVAPSTLLRRLYSVVDRKKANSNRGQIKTEVGHFGEVDGARIVIEHAIRHHELRRLAA